MDSAYAGLCVSSEQSKNKSKNAIKTNAKVDSIEENGKNAIKTNAEVDSIEENGKNAIKTNAEVDSIEENGETKLGLLLPLSLIDSQKTPWIWFYRMFILYANAFVSSRIQQLYFPLFSFKVLDEGSRLETYQAIIRTINNEKYKSIQFNFFFLNEDTEEIYKKEIIKRCKEFNCKRKISFPIISEGAFSAKNKQKHISFVFGGFLEKHFVSFREVTELTHRALKLYNLFVSKFILALVSSNESNKLNLIFPLSNFEHYDEEEYTNYIDAVAPNLCYFESIPFANFYFINDPKKNYKKYMQVILENENQVSFRLNVPDEKDTNATNLYITPLDCEED